MHSHSADYAVGSSVQALKVGEVSRDKLRFRTLLKLKGGAKVETTLFRIDSSHAWRLRAMVDGKRVVVATRCFGHTREDLELARLQATKLLQELWDGSFQSARAAAREARGMATLGEMARVYATGISARAGTGATTAREAVASAMLLVRTALNVANAECACADCFDGDRGVELLRRFQGARLAAVPKGADEVAAGRARRTIDGAVRKARAMFTGPALELYRAANLKVPDVTAFVKATKDAALGNWNEAGFVAIPAETLNAMTSAAWHSLRVSAPAVFCCYLLMRRAGLRNGDAMRAERSWLVDLAVNVQEPGGVVERTVTFLWDRAAKNGADLRIPLADDVAAALRAHGGARFLLGGDDEHERHKVAYVAINEWIRPLLPDREKGAYELRKHFGAHVASCLGIERAAQYLGDRVETVAKYYHAWLHDAELSRGPQTEDFTPEIKRVQRKM